MSRSRVFSSFATSSLSCSRASRRSSISSISLSRSPPSASFERSRSATRAGARALELARRRRSYLPRVTQPGAAPRPASAARASASCAPAACIRALHRSSPRTGARGPSSSSGLDLFDVLAVALRQHHAPDARALRREHLLLDAAHRQHAAAQRDLAGHRHVGRPSRPVSSEVSERHHRDARRRAVLGHRARRHVQVQVRGLRNELRVEAELGRVSRAATSAPPPPTRASRRRASR